MDRTQMLKVLVPVGGLAALLFVVGVVVALVNSGPTPDSGTAAPPAATGGNDPATPPPPSSGKFEKFPLEGPEWKELGGGLMYWDVKEGKGEVCQSPVVAPQVIPVLHYTGWLTNGTQFDSSRTPGKSPLASSLSALVKGWQKGVPGMRVGGTRRLIIPPELGYGAGTKGMIPPNSTLIFEMELLDLK